MAKLYFYYASMNAGKSTTLLQADFNYRERGMHTMLFTTAIDDRYEAGVITSRIGIDAPANLFTPLQAMQTAPQSIPHNVLTTLAFTGVANPSSGWRGASSFVPAVTSFYAWSGFIQLVDVAAASEAALTLYDAGQNITIAELHRTIGPGSPTLDFAFRERLLAGRPYQLRLFYKDAARRDRETSGRGATNRMLIERLR